MSAFSSSQQPTEQQTATRAGMIGLEEIDQSKTLEAIYSCYDLCLLALCVFVNDGVEFYRTVNQHNY